MADKLPSDFNPDAYASAYPDVALSGLGPREHYLRFGRLLGRFPSGKAPNKSAVTVQPGAVATPGAAVRPKPTREQPPAAPPSDPPARPSASQAIVDRPGDFHHQDLVPLPAPAKPGAGAGAPLALDDFKPADGSGDSCGPLRAYARMVGIAGPATSDEARSPRPCEPRFLSGACRIDNAWFADPLTIRLMIADGQSLDGWALRAFQALPASPAALHPAGPGILFPKTGPCFVDVVLLHPLMPLLFELVQPDGATAALALVPFPSLLTGGLHWAESKALQTAANPMDSFWSLSDQFLRELIDGAEAPARSIASVATAESDQPSILSDQERDWLAVIFGITARAGGAKAAGLQLLLPGDAIPTIAALVSRRLEDGPGSGELYLVAEQGSCRPRWSVALPSGYEAAGLPRLSGRGRARRKTASGRPPVHLAILYRRPGGDISDAATVSTPTPLPPMTILLGAVDPGRTEALMKGLQEASGSTQFEFLIKAEPGGEMRAALDRACGTAGWRCLDSRAGLRDVAHEARHETLVTIDDRVRLAGDTLQRLAALLDGGDDVASASCLLIGETAIKQQVVRRPGSGGLFPSRVSFIGGPAMAFAEPDVSDALRDMTYPVVANSFGLTAWRRDPVARLPDPAGPMPRDAEDIAIGLELTLAGWRNLCTTTFSATVAGDWPRRDAIDPFGTAVLQPGQLQELFSRVATVRELF